MRHALVLAALSMALTQAAIAASTEPFEWTKERFDLVAAGNSAAGEQLAKELRCAKCHNDTGVSDDEDIPTIAGQRATYMYKQLTDFSHGVRDDEDMVKVAKKMDEQQMADISAWFSVQDRPPMVGGEAPLVVKICDSCHEKEVVEEDNRIEVAPILAGQIRQYLEKSMLAFKQANRSNDLFNRMQSVSHKLSPAEIRSLSRYYGSQGE